MLRTHLSHRVRAYTHARLIGLACGLGVLGLLPHSALAAPMDIAARVLWSRDGSIYVAADDSTALTPGMSLELRRGRKRIATATVTRRLDAHVALARLDSGSLARERRLERLKLRAEAAPPAPRIAVARVGVPGRERASLLFRCAATSVDAHFAGAVYAADPPRGGTVRLIRQVAESGLADPSAAGAPDTLLVRAFSDAADQEIALERGELDVAVFWPGELSPRMRADARWRDADRGVRAQGVIAAVLPAQDTLGVPGQALAALDREAFAGDLLAWDRLEPTFAPVSAESAVGWRVDPALPGARLLERVLQRAGGPAATREAQLVYLDVPVAARDAVQSSWRAPGVRPLFALRCPVLVSPALRSMLRAMGGADAFANLVRCEAVAR